MSERARIREMRSPIPSVLLGVALVILTALLTYQLWLSYDNQVRAAEVSTRNLASIFETRLDMTLHRTDADLVAFAKDIPVAALEQKNTASSASSSGVVNCIDGSFSPSSCRVAASIEIPWAAALASTCFCTSGVSTQPGQMALQVTPVVAVSSATTLVRPTTPCLAAT